MGKIRIFISISFLAMIHFQAVSQGLIIRQSVERKFDAYKKTIAQERVFIMNDKDVYSPGEQVWFSGFTYDYLSSSLVNLSSQVKIDLVNSNNVKINGSLFNLVEGKVSGYIELPQGLDEGIYYLQGFTELSGNDSKYHRKILVKEKPIPPYLIEVSFADKQYLPGEEIPVTMRFLDFYSESKRSVSYQADFFDGDTKLASSIGKTKKDGIASFNLKIPAKLKSGFITYKISAEVRKQEVSHKGVIPVISDEIFVDFYPENGHMVNGKSTVIYCYAYDAIGQPIMIDTDLFASENVVQSVSTNSEGIGKFSLVPELGIDYFLKIKSPIAKTQKYNLPEIHPKGLTLSIVERTPQMIKYRLSSVYSDPRLVYLIGHSNGKVEWFSEHEVVDDIEVEVDISNWKPGIVQIALINAAERIEGEHVFFIDDNRKNDFELSVNADSPSQRSKIISTINTSGAGQMVFSAVNDPWLSGQLKNYNASIVAMPADFLEEPITYSSSFIEKSNASNTYEDLLHLYTPNVFAWSRILDTKGDFEQHQVDKRIMRNIERYEGIIAFGSEHHADGKIIQNNLIGSDYFYASNPTYISELYKEQVEREPSYKKMLENGTPILEVLKVIKPYNLQGSNIVFMGSANSLNFQGGALIAIDGVNRGTDASVLSTISPYDVESITASTDPNDIQRYTGLNSVGIVEIELKKGNQNAMIAQEQEPVDTQFKSPDYETGGNSSEFDERGTLYWSVTPFAQGRINTVAYFNSDLISNVQGKVIFFPASGIPQTRTFNYQVK